MVRFGGVTDFLPIPLFEFENDVHVRDLSFRTRLWCHNAISRIFTSTNLGRTEDPDLARVTFGPINRPESCRVPDSRNLRSPASPGDLFQE